MLTCWEMLILLHCCTAGAAIEITTSWIFESFILFLIAGGPASHHPISVPTSSGRQQFCPGGAKLLLRPGAADQLCLRCEANAANRWITRKTTGATSSNEIRNLRLDSESHQSPFALGPCNRGFHNFLHCRMCHEGQCETECHPRVPRLPRLGHISSVADRGLRLCCASPRLSSRSLELGRLHRGGRGLGAWKAPIRAFVSLRWSASWGPCRWRPSSS